MTIKHEEWVQRVRARELDEIPIPNEHRHKTLADVEVHDGNEDAVQAVEAWLKRLRKYTDLTFPTAGKGLLLFGPVGSGKTLLASVIANQAVLRGRRAGMVHFVSMEGFNRLRLRKMELGQMMDRLDPEDAAGLADEWWAADRDMTRCYEARLLVLDDVGQENTTTHLAGMLNEMLRDRYNHGRPTIITSNVHPQEWASRFQHEALASFVHQSCFLVSVAGNDARRARASG